MVTFATDPLVHNVARRLIVNILTLVSIAQAFAAESLTTEQTDFFEAKIRPVLVEHCYACHNAVKLAEGTLELDHRAGMLRGGDGGAIIVPGKPNESRLLSILRHEIPGLKMPEGGGKLESRVIADFATWIAKGAPDPRETPPTAEEIEHATSWEAVLNQRKKWWSFQPIRKFSPPKSSEIIAWSSHPIDRFVLTKLTENELEPNELADARTLVRRTYFALVGLPPTEEETEQWTARLFSQSGFEELVEHLLDSPHFGERWARHWMDWIRYADSHGSEGDPVIENGWIYRDYLIRALNADVSYDQLLREHIAGDLLDKPRINSELGINESLIGTAHWRMVFHGFSPTDALDEKVRFIDDQINTFSKAFLGITVSCARCHDHKFDAISQKDYYALFGILASCRPGRNAMDISEKVDANRDKLSVLKPQIRAAIAQDWLAKATQLREVLMDENELWTKAIKPEHVLHPWLILMKETNEGARVQDAWTNRVTDWENDVKKREKLSQKNTFQHWHMDRRSDYATWTRTGTGVSESIPSTSGEFSVAVSGKIALVGIYPSGVYSHLLSAKHPARITSKDVRLDDDYELWLRVIGDEGASARFVVQDYPRKGVVFPVETLTSKWEWKKAELNYWKGDDIHLEIAAGPDAPLVSNSASRSWFGVREVLIVKNGEAAPDDSQEFLDPWFEKLRVAIPESLDDAANSFVETLISAIRNWSEGSASDAQSSFLDACMKQGILSNDFNELLTAKPFIEQYRRLENAIVVPTRVPGLEETSGRTQALYVRGNHKQPGDIVPRRFLEAIDGAPYQTTMSGRLELTESLLDENNPLTRRVIVNRLWHHLFGKGIVATPDNLGRLGSVPTQPELLDYLADKFRDQGGSIKEMIRFMVTSKTWQLSSRPSAKAVQLDPDNLLLSHSPVRRLEAEAIRDSLLKVSGSLEDRLFGNPVDGNSTRRSVYMRVTRNALDPFLRAFDFPEPFSAVGRRDVTNVPAQSLTLMNDEHVASLAGKWAALILAVPSQSDEQRMDRMLISALGRPAEAQEISKFQKYLAETKAGYAEATNRIANLSEEIAARQAAIQSLLDPLRARLLSDSEAKSPTVNQSSPKPMGRWEFEGNLKDLESSAVGQAHNGVKVEGGALIVNQDAYVSTPLNKTLKEKTLSVWLQLDNLDQSGGGAMTIATIKGGEFDSIVFGEKSPREWLAGSNNFTRTQSFQGPVENEALERTTHVSIVYHLDGTIIGYRNGLPYGKPYKSNGPFEFKAGESVILFGIRHLPSKENRMLSGRIFRAELYDRALSDKEIIAISNSNAYAVDESKVVAALSEPDRQQLKINQQIIVDLEAQLAAFGPIKEPLDDQALWRDVARAIFTFKEFIFVK